MRDALSWRLDKEYATGSREMHVVGRWLVVLAMLACGLASVAIPPATVIAASARAGLPDDAVAMAGVAVPVSIAIRQVDPDLTAVKSNNVAGSVAAGTAWIWAIDIANAGAATATFTAGQIV